MAKQAASRISASTPKKRRESARPAPMLVTATPVVAPAPTPSHEAIARRAFELYESRAGSSGDEISDWLRAESELASVQA